MKNRWKKLAALAVSCVMASTMAFGFIACGDDKPNPTPGPSVDDPEDPNKKPDDEKPVEPFVPKKGTYRTFTSTMPSNWNELTYEDNNDTQILDYIMGSLFTFDYDFDGNKYNKDGSVNYDAIVEGGFTTQYDAAAKLEDVTATVDVKWGYDAEQKKEGGYAYKITLREDLKWHDGTAIDASDFIYSMKQQLDPDFMNFRANSYYDTLRIINAKDYFYQKAPMYDHLINDDFDNYVESGITKDADGYYLLPAGVATAEDNKHVYTSVSKGTQFFGDPMADYYNHANYHDYFFGEYTGEITDRENLPDFVVEFEGEEEGEYVYFYDYFMYLKSKENEYGYVLVDDEVKDALMVISANFGDGSPLSWQECCFVVSGYGTSTSWDSVGFYQDGDYSFVVCMEAPIKLFKDDGSLHYNAAYYFSGFPLVKKDIYDKCKQAPVTGATLWTSTYNSSLDTTASWGPYMLTDFQAGKSYTLTKNEHCYAFKMDEYKNQYNIDKITCEKIDDTNTQWMSFFAGNIDSKGLDNDHLNDYKNSKFAVFSPATYTYGSQIYGGLTALNNNGRNNSILAIPEFRQALSLALDREYLASDIVAPNQAAYGVLNQMYYYDVDNGGVYRLTTQAKEGLLRAYGYTQAADGTWSSSNFSGYDLDDAYDTLGGANMAKAKELVKVAIAKLTAPDSPYNYNSAEKITIDIGLPSTSPTYTKLFNTYKECWEEIVKGSDLEGRLNIISSDQSDNAEWSDDFRANVYDVIPTGAIGGNPFDPYDLIRCYIDPNYSNLNYHTYWDTNKVELTITFGEDDNAEYSGKTFTMSALNWWACLKGLAGNYKGQSGYDIEYTYVWSEGYLSESNRLLILAVLEETVITQYQFVPLFSSYSATLLGAKFSYASNEYNQFMGFGGMRYMTVNYTDSEWTAFVATFGTTKLEEYYKTSD